MYNLIELIFYVIKYCNYCATSANSSWHHFLVGYVILSVLYIIHFMINVCIILRL